MVQDTDVFELLAVCCLMAERGQLKACGEDRQAPTIFVDGQKGGAQWNEVVAPFHAKPHVLTAIANWRRRIGTIEATDTYRCGNSLCAFVRTQVPDVAPSKLKSLKARDTIVTVVRYYAYT